MGQSGHDAVTPLEAAREYVRRGWCVVPIPYKQKGAVIQAWEQLRLTDEELPQYFDQPANIGIALGEPSHWLVDVDLDCPEAIELADQFYQLRRPSLVGEVSYVRIAGITLKGRKPSSIETRSATG